MVFSVFPRKKLLFTGGLTTMELQTQDVGPLCCLLHRTLTLDTKVSIGDKAS